ncbi:lipopolysaccharide biosynthesis protein [Cohnella sp.]|uniref:lipopolysaccharide biosynthesis protein n=1 Tax=Cohnella sp. TaxID=1883426 RepID=UPI0035622910
MAEIRLSASVKRVTSSFTRLFSGKGLINETIKTMSISMVILVVNMATGMLTARLLGPEGRGMLTAMILWPQFLAFAGTFGIHAALLFHMKKSPDEEAELYYSALVLTVIAGVVALIAGYWFIPLWMAEQSQEIIRSGQWFMASTPFILLFFMHNALFRGREEFHLFNRMRYLVPVLSLAAIVLLAGLGQLTPFIAGITYLAPYIPVTLFAMIRAFKLYRPNLGKFRVVARKIMRYGFGSYGIDLLGNLILYIDQIILVTLLAPGPFGLYVVAVSLSRMVNVFSASINMVLFPKASGLENKEAAALSLRIFKISTGIAIICSLVIMLAAPLVIRVLYGSQFVDSIPVFRLLLLEVVIGGAALVLAQSFMAIGKPFIVTITQAIGVVLVIPLLYKLVPIYGPLGAAMALLIPSFIRLIYVIVSFQRKFGAGIRSFLLTGEDIVWVKKALISRKGKVKVSGE